jgi:hypothetical protein
MSVGPNSSSGSASTSATCVPATVPGSPVLSGAVLQEIHEYLLLLGRARAALNVFF